MSTTPEYRDYILDQLSEAEGITFRPMMGEYVLYVHGRVFGSICDNRFLVKSTPAARERMPDAVQEPPYPGGKPMLLVDNLDNRSFLAGLAAAMEPELPVPRRRRRTVF